MKKLLLLLFVVCQMVAFGQNEVREVNREILANFRENNPTIPQWEGMLSFSSPEQLEKYLDAVSELRKAWDYVDDAEYWDLPNHREYVGDEAVIAVDQLNTFSSLGTIQELQQFDNGSNSIKEYNYIGDPLLQKVLNAQKEVKVGDKVYKYMKGRYLAILTNPTTEDLIKLRTSKLSARMDNLLIYNMNNGITHNGGIEANPPAGCNGLECVPVLKNFGSINFNNDYNAVSLDLVFEIGKCEGDFLAWETCDAVEYTVDFGDGIIKKFTPDDFAGDKLVIYKYAELANVGDCKEYTIRITATLRSDCSCAAVGTTHSIGSTFKICKPATCAQYDAEKSGAEEYSSGNEKHRILSYLGQNVNAGSLGIFNKSYIWSTCKNQKWSNKSKDWYRASTPSKGSVDTYLYGRVYKDNCTNEEQHDKFDSSKSIAEATIKFGVDISTDKVDNSKKLKSKNRALNKAGSIFVELNLSLFP
jgi:hypothetical protein